MALSKAEAHIAELGDARRPRRRGAALEDAIFDAVLEELGDRGFARLTFEGVAARAHTGKSALYRRWPNKTELVLDTMDARAPDGTDFVARNELREDLVRLIRHMTSGLDGPAGIAMRALIGEAHHEPELFASLLSRFLFPRYEAIEILLRAAAARGEIDEAVLTRDVLEVIPAVVMHRYLLNQGPITSKVVVNWVDGLLLPLIIEPDRLEAVRSGGFVSMADVASRDE